jgi:transposase
MISGVVRHRSMSMDAATSATSLAADATALPDDPIILKRMIAELLATLHERDHELEGVRHRLDQLLRRLFGPRAERLDPAQILLFGDAGQPPKGPAASLDETPATVNNGTAGRGHGRRRPPSDLPRVRLEHDLPEAERACPDCGAARARIGADTSEQLDYQPASVFVVEHVRHTYACVHCQGSVTTASKPAGPIAKGLPGPGLLAHVTVSKYVDHLPLYRQERIFERQGVTLPRTTLCDWMAATAALLTPLYEHMKADVLRSRVLHTDDTPVPVQDPESDKTKTGRLWVYLGDREHPGNVFDYTPTRQRDGPRQFLQDYHGYLQADAFGGYDGIYATGRVVEVCCNAHARRKFYEARDSDAARAHQALAYYRQLYALEADLKDANDAERLRVRQAEAAPLWAAYRRWLDAERPDVLPKSPMGQAFTYVVNQWEALTRYTTAGFLAIDNNVAEREMKRIATGRKNWLFCGSDQGGRTAAVLFSFASTCQRHAVNPFAYLRDILRRLPSHPADQLAELLPPRWTPPNLPA